MSRTTMLDAHLARVLILLAALERSNQSTTVAKVLYLDFLLRYPVLLEKIARAIGLATLEAISISAGETEAISSHTMRYKFNPDQRRYTVLLGALVGMRLVVATDDGFHVTETGDTTLHILTSDASWASVPNRAEVVVELASVVNDIAGTLRQYLPDHFVTNEELPR
ncbi:MAG: hypothetical protein M9882_01020 [Homoserinimonas sp.]|nr:hypothetical protein [Homoserinimonas sp.]MCW5944907.1 hypothetical protein [Cryobacterium sp.]